MFSLGFLENNAEQAMSIFALHLFNIITPLHVSLIKLFVSFFFEITKGFDKYFSPPPSNQI